MKKHRNYYAGDMLSKIGCGLLGGAGVALYYNFATSGEKYWTPFITLLVIGGIIAIFGYHFIMRYDN
jgi:hypothetical protein